jgi:hypothetical protein
MSKIAEILRLKAEEFKVASPESIAVGMLKQAGIDETEAKYAVAQELMEKEAARKLIDKGVDVVEATKMVKAAGINIRELTDFKIEEFGNEVDSTAELLDKTASYIESLETETTVLRSKTEALALEKKAAEDRANGLISEDEFVEKQAAEQHLSKLNKSGAFTYEDLEQLKLIDPTVLQKVAAVMDEPATMGSGGGMAHTKTDPLLDFILG